MREDITPLPQYAFMAWCELKHRDNFTLSLPIRKIYLTSRLHRQKCKYVTLVHILKYNMNIGYPNFFTMTGIINIYHSSIKTSHFLHSYLMRNREPDFESAAVQGFFHLSPRPDCFWRTPSVLSKRCLRLFSRSKTAGT